MSAVRRLRRQQNPPMNREPSHSLGALPGMAGAAALTIALLAQAAETLPATPLLSKPTVASAPASAAQATANQPRQNPGVLGDGDGVEDLEVERVRGKKR